MNSLKSAFRTYRSLAGVVLLFLAALSGGIGSARATALGNGQIVYSTISGTANTTYTFTVSSGSFTISLWESGGHSATSNAGFQVTRPNGTKTGNYGDTNYDTGYLSGVGAVPGTYTVTVFNAEDSMTAAAYGLEVAWWPGTVAIPNGQAGGAMQPGVTYSDSVALGAFDIWTFQSTGSNPYSLALTKASGGAGFCSYMEIFNSVGAYLGTASTCTSTSVGGTLAAGTYYVYVTNAYLGNGTGSYTLKVSGTGVDMSGQGNGDGATCLTCKQHGPAPNSGGVVANGATATQP